MSSTRLVVASLASLSCVVALAATPVFTSQDVAMPQPTEHHALVLRGVGEWKGKLQNFVPGMEGVVDAKQTVKPVGKFWTQTRFSCQFMGETYVGTGCQGYDPAKKKFIGTWVDSMSSYFAKMEGDYDAKTNTLTMRWQAPDMEGKMQWHRQHTVQKENSYRSVFYMGEGEGTKTMVIEMERVKTLKQKAKKALETGVQKVKKLIK